MSVVEHVEARRSKSGVEVAGEGEPSSAPQAENSRKCTMCDPFPLSYIDRSMVNSKIG